MSAKDSATATQQLTASDGGPQAMTPSEAFVETMVANGVSEMFGIMGSAFMDAMDIFAPAGIRLIPVVHEQGAGHMADGYARVSGRHGVVMGQNGPGISNCVTAIAAAYWAHSPVVIVTPEAGTMGIGLGGFQEAKQVSPIDVMGDFAFVDDQFGRIVMQNFQRALQPGGSVKDAMDQAHRQLEGLAAKL